MATTEIMGSPSLAGFKQQWSFQKAMLQAQKVEQIPSDPPSPDMFSTSSTDDQIRISDHSNGMKNIKAQYMSSEEQLSPTEHDSASSTADGDVEQILDDEDNKDDWLDELFAELTCKMATAICFIQAGKAKVVEIPMPSLTSSPSVSSESDKMSSTMDFYMPRPRTPTRKRPVGSSSVESKPLRPMLKSHSSENSYSNASPSALVQTYKPTSSPERNSTTSHRVEAYTPTFLNTDPFANASPSHPSRTTSHGHSRLRNLSQKLTRFANSSKLDLAEEHARDRKDSVSSVQELVETWPRTRASISGPTVSKPRSKMVPRGAAERAPLIQIPPCPEDFDFDVPQLSKLKRRKSLLRF